ncbi:Iron uptake protein A1 precursor [Pseudovibrio axinellae]|uniref:Iron uptake protein A1 n=1 Tax=Pseudovibrio axinellae TaxID=989403 RepID=A0A161X9U9_9HYPH|nr:Fe(3+) ABC transporter substrate-binding protein [Pseudovibrio axinellae]KZL09468.1 Iron uptake protein A1 precursor [Pseudovibrio axinellae]SEQ63923.1 iron(III) transport system substrate-binding protein [Pseudovibrio axinellae]
MKSLLKGIGLAAAGCALGTSAMVASAQAEGEVNVYSYRQPELIQPLMEAFTEKTGVKANVVFAKKGLAERIQAEGKNSPADVLLSVDIGRLQGAKDLGITQPVISDVINNNIPVNLRDADNHWFGLTTRARVIYASKDRVTQDSITYEELADPKWRGRICTRSGQHDYSIGLFASMIANKGEAEAQKWLEAVRDNLARKPTGNDRAQVKSIFAGECDISLGNTYYMGKMQTNTKDPEQKDWAASVRILFPNTEDRGTHVNITGMVLAKNAPNKDNALTLMEFLASDEAQAIYAAKNFEYPVKPGVQTSDLVASWGSFKADSISLSDIAANRTKASEMVDLIGFDNGPSS